ncbi:MAG: hypothetical protein ACYTG2_08965 [Planctomycetota bacterium]
MLSTDEFKQFAEEFVMFAHVTTRIEGRKDDDLLSRKGFNSFPSLAVMNADGDLLAKLDGSRDVDGFREMMAAGAKVEEIRSRPDKSLDDEYSLLTHDINMGNADVESARARADSLEGLDEARRKEVEGLLTDLEIKAVLGQPKSREEFEELSRKAAGVFAQMWAEGRVPTSDEAAEPFYILILNHAETTGDVALFERSLAKLRETFGETERTARFFEAQAERLEKLKAGGTSEEAEAAEAEAEPEAEPEGEADEDGGG